VEISPSLVGSCTQAQRARTELEPVKDEERTNGGQQSDHDACPTRESFESKTGAHDLWISLFRRMGLASLQAQEESARVRFLTELSFIV